MCLNRELPHPILCIVLCYTYIVYIILYTLLVLFTFVALNKGNLTTLRALLINGYTDTIRRVRRSEKGLKQPYFKPIIILGEYPDGLTCAEAGIVAKSSRSAIYQRLKRGIKAGYVRKENKRYYLTDTGLRVYNAICLEFDASMNEIVKILVEEVNNKLK